MLNDYSVIIEESSKIMKFTLIYKNNKKQYSRNSFLIPEYLTNNQASIMENFNDEIFFSDYQNKIFLRHFEFLGKSYNIAINDSKDEWEILSDNKLINNFLCYKVVKKGNKSQFPVLWIAPELNFPIGPNEFDNFPGMILEVNYKLYSIYCEKIYFEKNEEEIEFIQAPEGEVLTKEEFQKILEKAKKNL